MKTAERSSKKRQRGEEYEFDCTIDAEWYKDRYIVHRRTSACDQEEDAVATFEACSGPTGWRESPHWKKPSRDSFGGDGAGLDGRACNAAFLVA